MQKEILAEQRPVSDGAEPGFADLLAFAHRLADLAAEAILPHFRATATIDNKSGGSGFDPVTAADREAEEVIRAEIARRWPDHGVLGEEFGESGGAGMWRWVIDPIDGTRAFIAGQPVWGTLIGLERAGRPLLGLMNQPWTRERYWSGKDAAWRRDAGGETRIATRKCASLEAAVLTTTGPEFFARGEETERFGALGTRVRMLRFGGDCYGYCMMAAGHTDLVVEARLKAHDIAPLIPIIEKAGGVVTTWDGGDAAAGGRIVAAGDRAVHAQALEVLSG